MAGARGKNLSMRPVDQIGIEQDGGEGYALPDSVARVLAPLSVSPQTGNQLGVAADGLLYVNSLVGSDITRAGFIFTYSGPSGSVSWHDGRVSLDGGNTLTRGSDGGLFAPSDSVSLAADGYTLTHTAADGAVRSWKDGRVSTDAGNIITRGSDGGLFISAVSGLGGITRVGSTLTWTDGLVTVQWEDGCVSADAGNALTRGSDQCLFVPTPTVSLLAGGLVQFQNGIGLAVTWGNGVISTDAGNALSRGTDDGLYLPSDAVSVAADTYTMTHVAVDGSAVSWEDGRISGDAGNVLVRGSDGGLFVSSSGAAGGAELTIWLDTSAGSDANDGLTSSTPVQSMVGVGSVVSSRPGATLVTVVLNGQISSSWAANSVFLPHQDVVLKSWNNDASQSLWTPDSGVLSVRDVRSLTVDYGSVGLLDAYGVSVHVTSDFRGRLQANDGARITGSIFDWVVPSNATLSGYSAASAGSGCLVMLSTTTLTANVGGASSFGGSALYADGAGVLSLEVGTATITMDSDQSSAIECSGGGLVQVSGSSLTVNGAGNDVVFVTTYGRTQVDLLSLSLSLTNGAQNRIIVAEGAIVTMDVASLDASVRSDGGGMFRLRRASLFRGSVAVVDNTPGVASGDVLSCDQGSDFRLWGQDPSGTTLDKNVLRAALQAGNVGTLGPSSTARIGDTYYTPTATAVY